MDHSNRRHMALAWLILAVLTVVALGGAQPVYAESEGVAVRCTGFGDLPVGAITSFAIGGQEFLVDDLCVYKGMDGDPNVPGELTIEKSVETAGPPVQPGDVMTYTVRIKHQGSTDPAVTVMTDPLPAGVELAGPVAVVEETAGVWPLIAFADFNRVKWHGELSAGAQVAITFPVRVNRCMGQALNIVNTASAVQTNGTRITASVKTDVTCPSTSPVAVTKWILMDSETEVQEAEIGPGMESTFRLKVTNSGELPAIVALRDRLPQGMVTTDTDKGRTYVETVLHVGPGATETFDFGAKLVEEFSANHELINQARYVACMVDRPDGILCHWPPDNDPFVQTTNPVKLIVNGLDLGDAPASNNHFTTVMTAYPDVPANFPTVFDPKIGAFGPAHERTAIFRLGKRVSQEVDADRGADTDPLNNIVPPLDLADRDHFDDGLFPGRMSFAHCERTTIPVEVYIAPAALTELEQGVGYLNIWVDGNRDGDWADTLECPQDAEAAAATAYEHAVVDYQIHADALGPGIHVIPVVTTHPVLWPEDLAGRPAWIRATLSEDEARKLDGKTYGDGSGKGTRFALGETEDYLWRPPLDPANGPDLVIHKRGTIRPVLPVEEEVAGVGGQAERIIWAVDYGNVGAKQATGVTIDDDLSNAGDTSRYVIRTYPETAYTWDGTRLHFDVGTLDPGERGHIVIKLGLPASGSTGSFTNVAEIAADVDVNLDNNLAEASTELGMRAPIITWPADGTTCKNTITVRGVAVPGSEVDLYVDDMMRATIAVEPGARWSHELTLTDGTHTIYAIARLGSLTSPPSRTLILTVDSELSWSPLTLRFTNEFGYSFQPRDEDGRTDPAGWAVHLRPNRPYAVSVELCCTAPGASVKLELGDTLTVDLVDLDGDNVYTGAFTSPEQSQLTGTVMLNVQCGSSSISSSGVLLIDPEGVVYDVKTASALSGSIVACMQAQVAAAGAAATTVFDAWPGAEYGQENPQMTSQTGHFSFFTAVGQYRLDVSKSGYQPYRSTELDVVDEPVHYDVPLTAQIRETAHHVVVIDEYGFEPPYLEIRPGEIVEWVNMATSRHTATSWKAQMGAAAVGDVIFDSGLLLSGESYKYRFDTEEVYNYVDGTNTANLGTIVVGSAVTMNQALYLPIIGR